MSRLALIILTIGLLSASGASVAYADATADCNQRTDVERRIGGCSILIEQRALGDQHLAKAYHNRGSAYRAKEDYDRAIADFSSALAIDPKLSAAHEDRRIAVIERSIVHWSIVIDRGVLSRQEIAAAYNNRGVAYGELKGKSDRAMADWSKAIEINPQSKAPYNNRAWGYFKLGKAAQGLNDANRAIELDSNFAHAYDVRGHIHEALGRKAEALADFQKALSLDPTRKGAKEGLQRLRTGSGIPPVAASSGLPPARATSSAAVPQNIELKNDDEIRKVLKSEKGTIVLQITSFDPECKPCVDANRSYESLAARHPTRLRFIRVHYEPWSAISQTSIAAELNLYAVPAILLFQEGQEQRRLLGHQPERVLEELLFGESKRDIKRLTEKSDVPAADITRSPSERLKVRQAASTFVGCFQDQGNPWGKEGRDLNGARWDDSAMTSARCINFCRSQNFTYAATQYAVACFCGNSYGRSGRADNCNMPCAGNDKEMCGGSWANSVWRVGAGSAEAPAVAPALLDDGNVASASDASLKPYNGVWATSRALCRKYVRHISDAKYLGDVTNFVSPPDEGAYLISSRSIRFFDEANNECRLVKIDGLPKTMSATMTCFNAVNPDVSTVVLNIAKSNQNYIFQWKQQYRGVRDEKVYQCISMRELSETMARLWTFDSKKCAATTAHPEANVIFSKDLAENLIITVTGKIGSAFKNDFAARIFIDQLQPIELSAKAIAAGFSLPLGPFASRSSMISDGFLMSIWTEEMASRGSGVYKVPVLELPLLGSGRAMTFLRQCQHKGALAPAPSDQERVRQFIRDFIARLDREVPDFKHKEPRHRVVDLNDDGRSDIIVVADSPGYCGSAGCDMFVYVAKADGQFRPVYEKKSGDESLPVVGPERKDGYLTLSFPYAAIGDHVVHEVAVWEKDQYRRSHYRDGDIRIDPIPAERKDGFKTDGVLRDRPSVSAAPVESPVGFGFDMELGTVVTGQGSWIVARHCKGCRFGYARVVQ